MLTVDEAFRKFKSRLELNDREQANARRVRRKCEAISIPSSRSIGAF
jgi:hypothetical protein